MNTTQSGSLTASGAATTGDIARAQDHGHDHGHQTVPSDLTLRVKALESLLVEKGLVDPGGARCVDRYLRAQGRPAQRRAGGSASLGRSRLQAAPAD